MNNKGPDPSTSKTGQEKSERGFIDVAQTVSMLVLIVGAAGSLVFMFRAGQQTPRLLLVLFTLWVLAPFTALLWASRISKRRSALTRATLYCVTLIVALGSLAIYGEWIDVKPTGSANAFLYVAVPPISFIFSAVIVGIAALLSRGQSHSKEKQ